MSSVGSLLIPGTSMPMLNQRVWN